VLALLVAFIAFWPALSPYGANTIDFDKNFMTAPMIK